MAITSPLKPIDGAALRVRRKSTSFRSLLRALHLRRVESVLDVGAGGFVGETTTTHLLDLLDAAVTAVELHPERVAALEERVGDRLEGGCGGAVKWGDGRALAL